MTGLCLFPQETSYGPAPISGSGTTVIAATAYEKSGAEEQKRVVLRGVAGGRVEAITRSEPGAGSDLGARTPEGTGLSIVVELVATRHDGTGAPGQAGEGFLAPV